MKTWYLTVEALKISKENMGSSVHGARTIGFPYGEKVKLDPHDRIKSRCLKNMKVKGKLKILQSKMGVFLWP